MDPEIALIFWHCKTQTIGDDAGMETILTQAPAGGAVSTVNGQFYKGGQWLPETGLFCGAKRSAKKWAKPTSENWAEISVESNFPQVRTVFIQDGQRKSRRFYLVKTAFASRDEAVAFASEVIRLRNAEYVAQGFAPHPTKIVDRF